MIPQIEVPNNPQAYKLNQAKVLKISAVAIAAPRYIGAFGASIGVSAIELVPALRYAEMLTGGAMAILEGFALAFILGKIALLEPGSVQHKQLTRFAWLIALTLPIVGLPYLLAEQNQQSIQSLFAGNLLAFALQVAWSLTVLAVPVFVVMAVGYADIDAIERAKHQAAIEQTTLQIKQESKQVKLLAQAELEQTKQEIEQTKQEIEQAILLPFVCENCGKGFSEQKGLNGHKAHCKAKANGIAQMQLGEVVG